MERSSGVSGQFQLLHADEDGREDEPGHEGACAPTLPTGAAECGAHEAEGLSHPPGVPGYECEAGERGGQRAIADVADIADIAGQGLLDLLERRRTGLAWHDAEDASVALLSRRTRIGFRCRIERTRQCR
jgi:hypothetical protein